MTGVGYTFGDNSSFPTLHDRGVPLQELVLRPLFRIKKAIRDARDLHHFGYVVHAHYMGSMYDARSNRCGGAPDTVFGRSRVAVPSQGRAQESLPRGAHQQRISELRQLREFLKY